jgi:DUF4097 and DUF4098 domain-containing protein YvlB
MKIETLILSATAVVCGGWLLCPDTTQAARHGYNLNFNGEAETCADLKVSSTDGEVAKFDEKFTMTRAEAPLLELNGGERANIYVRGWDRAEYSVETCKVAVAGSRAEAERLARGISVTHSAGRLAFNGPAVTDDSGQWNAVFLIHAPKDAAVDLETKNGPISARDLNGTVKLRALNGPVAIRDCGGNVEAHTTNGPIAFAGDRGEVHLRAQNGPIALKLSSEAWNGSQLEARTINGPLAVSLPEHFRTGMRLETAGHAPLSCSAEPCRSAFTDATQNGRTVQMNGASDTIRLSTENGPVAIHSGDAKGKVKVF